MECKKIQDKLDAYLLKALEDIEIKEIENHLKKCSKCKKALKETAKVLEDWKTLPGIEVNNSFTDSILLSCKSKSKNKRIKRIFPSFIVLFLILIFFVLWMLWTLINSHKNYPYYHLILLEKAIWHYYIDHNLNFPKNSKELYKLLEKDKFGGPYLSKKVFKIDKNKNILDPWGTPYRYKMPGKHFPKTFDLYSCGPNKKDEQGKGDDIANWKKYK